MVEDYSVLIGSHRYFQLNIDLSKQIQLLGIGNVSLVANDSAVVHFSLHLLQKVNIMYCTAGHVKLLHYTTGRNDRMYLVAVEATIP